MQWFFKMYLRSRDTFWDSTNGITFAEKTGEANEKKKLAVKRVTIQFVFILWSMELGIGTNFSLGAGSLFASKVIHIRSAHSLKTRFRTMKQATTTNSVARHRNGMHMTKGTNPLDSSGKMKWIKQQIDGIDGQAFKLCVFFFHFDLYQGFAPPEHLPYTLWLWIGFRRARAHRLMTNKMNNCIGDMRKVQCTF